MAAKSENMDQRICIKFCVKNKIKCSETLEMLTVAYGETALSKKNVYKWYKIFQDGREDANDEPRSGRPSTSTTNENVDKVKEIVMQNRRITVREVAEDVGISVGSCHSIFSDVLAPAKKIPATPTTKKSKASFPKSKASNKGSSVAKKSQAALPKAIEKIHTAAAKTKKKTAPKTVTKAQKRTAKAKAVATVKTKKVKSK